MAQNYQILKLEIDSDSLGRGYSGMSDKEVADDLNTAYRQQNRNIMTASEVMNAINVTEFNALNNANTQMVWDILHIGDINPFGVEATLFTNIFGAGSTTITTLAALRRKSISRARELGLDFVKEGHVIHARSI